MKYTVGFERAYSKQQAGINQCFLKDAPIPIEGMIHGGLLQRNQEDILVEAPHKQNQGDGNKKLCL